MFLSALSTLCVGSDGYVVSDLPPVINEIEIEASAIQDPRVKTVVTVTINLIGQGILMIVLVGV